MLFANSQKFNQKNSKKTPLGVVFFLSSMFIFFTLYAVPCITFANVNAITSRNWSGYVSSAAGSYSGIGASWIVPKATSTVYSADATWVGISGMGKTDLIQVGTHALTDNTGLNKTETNFTYKAWYEILPSVPVIIPIAIKPGDSITVSILEQSANSWIISFNNVTTNQNYKTSVYYVSSMSSAEWIQEMPFSNSTNAFVPLDNFGTVSFINSWAIVNGNKKTIEQLGGQPISMLNYSNQPLAITSTLGFDGGSFSITRTNAAITSSIVVTQVSKKINVQGVNVMGLSVVAEK